MFRKSNYDTKAGEIISTFLSIIFGIFFVGWLLVTKEINFSSFFDIIGVIFMIFLGLFMGGLLGMIVGIIIDKILSFFID